MTDAPTKRRFPTFIGERDGDQEPLTPGDLAALAGRPKTRAHCPPADENGRRACPWAGCRHHTYLDISSQGRLLTNFPGLEPHEIPSPCSLDIAERGGATGSVVGGVLGVVRARIGQIEETALANLRDAAERFGLSEPTNAPPRIDPPRHAQETAPVPDATKALWNSIAVDAGGPPPAVVPPSRPLAAGRRVALEVLGRTATMGDAAPPAVTTISVVAPPATTAIVAVVQPARAEARVPRRHRRAVDADRRALRRLFAAVDRAERPEQWRPLVSVYARLLARVEPEKVRRASSWSGLAAPIAEAS